MSLLMSLAWVPRPCAGHEVHQAAHMACLLRPGKMIRRCIRPQDLTFAEGLTDFSCCSNHAAASNEAILEHSYACLQVVLSGLRKVLMAGSTSDVVCVCRFQGGKRKTGKLRSCHAASLRPYFQNSKGPGFESYTMTMVAADAQKAAATLTKPIEFEGGCFS